MFIQCKYGDGTVQLTLKEATENDSGVYVAKAANRAGEARCTASVSVTPGFEVPQLVNTPFTAVKEQVMERPAMPMKKRTSEFLEALKASNANLKDITFPKPWTSGSAPAFTKTLPTHVEIEENEELRLECVVTGDPPPEVRNPA
jgi:hypothetical protein